MLAMKCDRCGKYHEVNVKDEEVRNSMYLYLIDNHNIVLEKEYYDLCPECAAKLKKFLEGDKSGK